MTYDQYWNQDCTLVRAYHKAAKIKKDMENHQAWLQGMYIYEALCCVAPALNAMKPKKPAKYRAQPYDLEDKRADKASKVNTDKQEKQDLKAKTMMEIFALNFNKRFEKKGGGEDGG